MYPGFTCGLFVTLVDACNINCSFCPFPPKKDFRSGGVLDYEKFLKMLSSLKTNPPSIPLGAVSFCGSGEPLLYKRLTELVAETTKRVPQVSLVTNGLLLNESTAKELIKSNINHIVISITGDTSEVYNHYQGNGQSAEKAKSQLELVRHNVKQLVKIRDKSKGITQIGISYILHEDSKKDLFSALNYYNSIGINYTDIRIRSDGFSLTGDDFEEYVAENRTKFDTQGGGACTCFGKVMNVSTDGTLRFCNCSYINETIIGNIFDEPLADILHTEKFTSLMAAFHGKYEQIPDFCRTCDLGRARPILA